MGIWRTKIIPTDRKLAVVLIKIDRPSVGVGPLNNNFPAGEDFNLFSLRKISSRILT